MEEADVLCNRIGIVTQGVLRCVGPQVRLKTTYGGGYHLFINCHKTKYIKLLQKEKKKQNKRNRGAINNDYDENRTTAEIHEDVKNFVLEMCPNAINIKDLVFQVSFINFLTFRSQMTTLTVK